MLEGIELLMEIPPEPIPIASLRYVIKLEIAGMVQETIHTIVIQIQTIVILSLEIIQHLLYDL